MKREQEAENFNLCPIVVEILFLCEGFCGWRKKIGTESGVVMFKTERDVAHPKIMLW